MQQSATFDPPPDLHELRATGTDCSNRWHMNLVLPSRQRRSRWYSSPSPRSEPPPRRRSSTYCGRHHHCRLHHRTVCTESFAMVFCQPICSAACSLRSTMYLGVRITSTCWNSRRASSKNHHGLLSLSCAPSCKGFIVALVKANASVEVALS